MHRPVLIRDPQRCPTRRGSHSWGRDNQKGVSLTIEQVLAAFFEQAADVEWDEELGAKRIAIQVTGQCKGTLQNGDQQKATGSGFSVPTLDLVESKETMSSPSSFRQEKILPKDLSHWRGGMPTDWHVHLLMFTGSKLVLGRKSAV